MRWRCTSVTCVARRRPRANRGSSTPCAGWGSVLRKPRPDAAVQETGVPTRSDSNRRYTRNVSAVSLRWRVMLLAMSMVAMVVVLMAVAVYAVVVPLGLRRHRHPVAQPGAAAHRAGRAGRGSRQGHRGHRVLRCQRDAGQPGLLHLHRQPAGPDAAARRAGESRRPG